jgi:hypothetical protein
VINRRAFSALCAGAWFAGRLPAQSNSTSSTNPLPAWLANVAQSPQLAPVFAQASALQLRISYAKVIKQTLQATQHYAASPKWFAPASLVKLPLAAFALEFAQELAQQKGWDWRNLALSFPEMPACATRAHELRGKQSLTQIIERAMVVSDDSAYCALYDFLGPQWIATRLQSMGYLDVHIQSRFGNCGPEQSAITGPVVMHAGKGDTHSLQKRPAFKLWQSATPIRVGKAWMHNGQRVEGAKDFSNSNTASMDSLLTMMQALKFSQQVPVQKRFRISSEARAWLWQLMAKHPTQCDVCLPADRNQHPSSFRLLGVGDRQWPQGLHVHNKVGWSYGFLSDLSYLQHNERACFIGVAMYLNRDEVLNDGRYEYDSIGRPFMAELGRALLAQ